MMLDKEGIKIVKETARYLTGEALTVGNGRIEFVCRYRNIPVSMEDFTTAVSNLITPDLELDDYMLNQALKHPREFVLASRNSTKVEIAPKSWKPSPSLIFGDRVRRAIIDISEERLPVVIMLGNK